MVKKCVLLYSDGLDSILALKIMQEQGYEVVSLFFILPFMCKGKGYDLKYFYQFKEAQLKIIDCTSGKLLDEYLEMLKNPKYRVGKGINPCIDCRMFMLKKAKEFADEEKIDLLVSGEVLGERPMSQTEKSMKLIEEELGLNGRLLRPLSAKLMNETNAEKQGLVNRESLYSIQGRRREEQMKLTKKFNVSYPTPSGGCLLCEKLCAKRFKKLLDENLINEKTLPLAKIGRHFFINNIWFVVSRDEAEGEILEGFTNCIVGIKGAPVVYYSKPEGKKIAEELQRVYKERSPEKFREFKI
jgi:tRNA U34 2-thiouridine synthase MnmA/TrmU